MSMLIPVLPKTRFEYSYLSVSGSQAVTIAPAIDVTQFKTLTLLVRYHAGSGSASQSWAFNLYSTLPSEEDALEFTNTTPAVVTVTVPGNTSAGSLLSASNTMVPIPPAFGKLVLTANQGGSGGAVFYAELSAALLGREN